jgi:hypothetical protein
MSARQAVILIHGIGEQRPMDTLRGFVKCVWSDDKDVHSEHGTSEVWSKPDRISGSFELRRLTTGRGRNAIRTDFFEFYWAHLMRGTRPGHVIAWARMLLSRWPWQVPRALFGVWLLLVLASAALGFAAYNGYFKDLENSLLGLAVSAIAGGFLLGTVGDAARYLNPAPSNVRRREEIRAKGVELLGKLHDAKDARGKPLYDRIIVVGHSLGSVIGYDVLNYAWADFHMEHAQPDGTPQPGLEALEAAAGASPLDTKDYRAKQRTFAEELRRHGNRWRVTDFVTLGSPLAHGALLLARYTADLKEKRKQREYPACPPVPETGSKLTGFSFPLDDLQAYRKPHHAAVFAPTRWTNLYFPAKFVFWGDLIGGPLQPVFGPGISDVPVTTRRRLGLFSHTLYWDMKGAGRETPAHVRALREAVNLLDKP